MIVLVVVDPLDSLRHAIPVVHGVEPPLDRVTMPFGLNCRVVEAIRLTSPLVDQGNADPTLVNVAAHDGGVPDRVCPAIW
jgi:hypothetical protein